MCMCVFVWGACVCGEGGGGVVYVVHVVLFCMPHTRLQE